MCEIFAFIKNDKKTGKITSCMFASNAVTAKGSFSPLKGCTLRSVAAIQMKPCHYEKLCFQYLAQTELRVEVINSMENQGHLEMSCPHVKQGSRLAFLSVESPVARGAGGRPHSAQSNLTQRSWRSKFMRKKWIMETKQYLPIFGRKSEVPQIGLDYKENGQTHKIHWTNPLLGKQTYRVEIKVKRHKL